VRRHPIRAPDALEAPDAGPAVPAVRAHAAVVLEPVAVDKAAAAEVDWRAAMVPVDVRAPAVVAV